MRHYHIPIFIPDYGCPFRCIFCNQHTITSTPIVPKSAEVEAIVDKWLTTISEKDSVVEVAFFGGNFTGIPLSEQVRYLEAVQPFLQSGQISGIRISTRPDAINENILLQLKSLGVKTIELGAQSFSDEVLRSSQRGHTASDIVKASLLILKHGFALGLQMMVGLPNDNPQKALNTAQQIVNLGATETRIYPVLVIKNTLLETQYIKGEYTPLSLDEAVEATVPIYKLFQKNDVKILKVGLHPTEGFNSGKDLVAGPYHPNFRELVLSKIWEERFFSIKPNSSIAIHVNPLDVNHAVGFGSINKHLLAQKSIEVDFIRDHSILRDQFYVDYL